MSEAPPVRTFQPWRVGGLYFEACNCEAICPCRQLGGRKGGRSTYGVCDFALGWSIDAGQAAGIDLSGLQVVLAGSYSDDEQGSPWRVALYLDERAEARQREALEAIFLGRAGGTSFANFARNIAEVYAVRRARIAIDHTPGRRRIGAGQWVEVVERGPVPQDQTVSCAIPGHDHPGQEVFADVLAVREPKLAFEVRGRCGFATDYEYRSDD
jgi:hypothetical protein